MLNFSGLDTYGANALVGKLFPFLADNAAKIAVVDGEIHIELKQGVPCIGTPKLKVDVISFGNSPMGMIPCGIRLDLDKYGQENASPEEMRECNEFIRRVYATAHTCMIR